MADQGTHKEPTKSPEEAVAGEEITEPEPTTTPPEPIPDPPSTQSDTDNANPALSEEASDSYDDNDSALGSNFASDTTSLKAYITDYRYEHGRRYNAYKPDSYYIANDELQLEQLDIAHHLHALLLDGKLFLAPIGENPQKVLDLGTGTGIWAIDFADEFPSASVTGTDLSPVQPHWVPPNVRFEIEDYNDSWTFEPNSFDYIHMRCLFGSVTDWPKLYKEVYNHIKPGGWIEQHEISTLFQSDDDSIKPGSHLALFNECAIKLSKAIGTTITLCEDMKDNITNAGFINVVEKVWKAPHGPWPADPKMKELGNWGLLELEVGLEGFSMLLLTSVLGLSYEESQIHLAHVRKELRDMSIHSWHYIRVVYGQKPFDA